MTRLRRIACLWLLVTALGTSAWPQTADQGPTTLVADIVRLDGDTRLVAEGNVEVFSMGTRLRAQRLTYDRAADRLTLEGPILIDTVEGTFVLADGADLSPDLRSGILTGARIILNDSLQIAGAEMIRTEGRFNDARRIVASSCEVCVPGRPPLWEIRAGRVIHDEAEAQVYFYNARFRIVGIPVFYLPTLRVPDGSDPRVRGFLTPSGRSTTELGNGIKLPYFVPLGDHADLTLTPYFAQRYTSTLEGRYRQALASGDIRVEGAVSRDSIRPGETRGYLFFDSNFWLPRGFSFLFNFELTSDDPYLRDYEYSDKDRLDSSIGISRVRQAERIEGLVTYYESLRVDADDDSDPTLVGDLQWDRRFAPPGIGGWADLALIGHFHYRQSDDDVVGLDMAQIRGRGEWRNAWTGPGGLRFAAHGRANLDAKEIRDDDAFPRYQTALTPEAAATMSWPMMRAAGAGGAYQVLEPLAQLAWTASGTLDSPNDDSTDVALDAGNLFAFNRFPGLDRFEEGTRANLALRWRHVAPGAWSLGLTGGQVYRFDRTDQFSESSGLSGVSSDWLAQIDLDIAGRLFLRNIALLDSGFDPTLNETRLGFNLGGFGLSSSYIWQREDRLAGIDEDISEVAALASYAFNDNWSGNVAVRHDFIAEKTNESAAQLIYRNECVTVDLSVRQRFRATVDTEPTTTYGVTVTLAGLGSGNDAVRRGSCANGG